MVDRDFILLGNAIFTVQNTNTNNRFTFKVRKPSANSPHFVSLLTGPNNQADYTFLGTIFNERNYRHGKKSVISYDAPGEKAFSWLWDTFDNLPSCININHEGYCGRCGRLLTTPESVESGIGPVCAGKI